VVWRPRKREAPRFEEAPEEMREALMLGLDYDDVGFRVRWMDLAASLITSPDGKEVQCTGCGASRRDA
jgi:hypothetical protein